MVNSIKCRTCKDKGYYEAYPIDGMTIYRWQKPKKFPCTKCSKGKSFEFQYGSKGV